MTNPQIADQIASFIIKEVSQSNRRTFGITGIGEGIKVHQDVVMNVFKNDLFREKPHWFVINNQSYGRHPAIFEVKKGFMDEIINFMSEGGFTQLQRDRELYAINEYRKEETFRNKQIDNLDVLTLQAKKAMEDSDAALRLSKESIAVSRSAKKWAIIAMLVSAAVALGVVFLDHWISKQ